MECATGTPLRSFELSSISSTLCVKPADMGPGPGFKGRVLLWKKRCPYIGAHRTGINKQKTCVTPREIPVICALSNGRHVCHEASCACHNACRSPFVVQQLQRVLYTGDVTIYWTKTAAYGCSKLYAFLQETGVVKHAHHLFNCLDLVLWDAEPDLGRHTACTT